MKTTLILFGLLLITGFSFSQNTKTVHAKGSGINKDEALQDALRNAVSQAAGTVIQAVTQVENFVTVRDAVSAKTEGYIVSYNVAKETPLSKTYEVEVDAVVSLDPIKQNAATLDMMVGGIRFLTLFDSRKFNDEKIKYLDFATERINEKLKINKYRYIEKERFDALKDEAFKMFKSDTSQVSYIQKLGLFADAQFIIFIKDINIRIETKAEGLYSVKATIDAKAYDNCVAEGLGTAVLEGDWKIMKDVNEAVRLSITDAIDKGYSHLMLMFSQSIADWVNNGAPYELRFYGFGTPRNLRGLIEKLKNDKNFGGSMEPNQTSDFVKLNCTYKMKSYDMYNKVLDYADEIPELKAKVVDAKLQYGRQISFAPQDVPVKEADEVKAINAKSGAVKSNK